MTSKQHANARAVATGLRAASEFLATLGLDYSHPNDEVEQLAGAIEGAAARVSDPRVWSLVYDGLQNAISEGEQAGVAAPAAVLVAFELVDVSNQVAVDDDVVAQITALGER